MYDFVYRLQVSRLPNFLPRLKELQIHSHTAVDLLQTLDEHFCKKIEVLLLNMKDDSSGPEPTQQIDMASIFVKFENLTTLHLKPSSLLKIDLSHLFAICPALMDIKRIVE